jgi:imidazolonepropionase-like amidohydrolase
MFAPAFLAFKITCNMIILHRYWFILVVLAVVLPGQSLAQETLKPEKGVFALTNATLHTVTKGVIERGTLIIRDGKIASLGAGITAPADAQVIDCAGMHIYPGLIDSGTRLGLSEVGSISLTQDYNEIGDVIPHMEALTALNPNATAIPVTRTNGVTTVLTGPSGGLFPGAAAFVNLVGYTPEQMYAGFRGVVLNYPSSGRRGFWDRRSEEDVKKDEERALKKLNEVWEAALLYHRIDSAAAKNGGRPDFNPEMAALLPAARGETALLIEVNKDKDIESAIKWVKDRKIKKAIFTGVAEGWRVADKLAEAGIPVITGPVLSLPTRASDRYDKPYANAGLMRKAGVKVALRTGDIENVRNLPFNAGYAAAYGMGKEEALKAVTIAPAEIFGVADKLGSLEVGKSATLFAATGDPFETKTQVVHLFIDGWKVPIDNRHIRFYEEFLDRQPGITK